MKNRMLRYYMHDGPSTFRFELAGDIDNEGARELDQAWRTASSTIGARALVVDITFVTGAENNGRRLLARWHAEGARLIARSRVSRKLAEAIVGEPLPEPAAWDSAYTRQTWLPFHAWFKTPKLPLTLLVAALALPIQTHAADLRPETVAAWDDYVRAVSDAQERRARPGGNFLWTFEDPARIAKALDGDIVVAPAPGPSPRKVPGGLIHHWMAAAFVPNAKLNDVLQVTQDYDRYREFYRPSVIASKMVARELAGDCFSMVLMNKALFLKTTLDADYQATNVRVDERRFYSISKTTRVQEIEDYGQAREHRFREGEGNGYIWKLFGVVRLAELGEGVYVEVEAIALSREIPGGVRLLVEPIVRRVSRNALLISLQQTEDAVRASVGTMARSARLPENVALSSRSFAKAH